MSRPSIIELVCDCGIWLRVEDAGDDRSVVITVEDSEQLLGRLLVSADEVTVFQPNEISGSTIEWVGLP